MQLRIVPVALFLGAASASLAVFADPYKEVVRAFDPRVDMNAELLVRRVFPDSGVEWTYKFQTSTVGAGSVFLEFIHPTTLQGRQIIIDTKQYREFDPQNKVIYVLSSPLQHEPSASERTKLLKANYTATYEGTSRIAGRTASVVKLVPKNGDLYQRRIWVDQKALFMLKHDVWQGNFKQTVFQTIQFKGTGKEQTFDFSANRGTRLDGNQDPRVIRDPAMATGLMGLPPVGRPPLPYGLTESVRQVWPSKSANRPMVVKLTDGVATVSVWIWKSSGSGSMSKMALPGQAVSPMVEAGNAGIFVEGDLPQAARMKIAEAFKKSIGTGEPVALVNVLN